ncbi:ATP-binding protein [Pleionea sediminis]|uniref:ATP-binding protein n=1 Tax=Pleionea sediminis TaxID=2569479 RepID=UPI0011856DC4|nr:ATP-binding protein [Pleionea sediminis]
MSANQKIIEQRFNAQPKNLKAIRDTLYNSMKTKGFSEECTSDVVLAVDEACQNIIRHAYQFDDSGIIDLGVYLSNNTISVELIDFADPVDPACCVPKAQKELKPGGLGTMFMNKLMDSVEYECPPPKGTGNKLVMKKHNRA